jgi:AcrR family transcriptional regulator
MMTDRTDPKARKRAALAAALGDIVLAEGLDALALRPAAARLGTSDRMLLYYFGTKAELVADTLADVSRRLAGRLAAIPPGAGLSPAAMIDRASRLIAEPELRPFMALWAEVVARAVRGDPAFAATARAIGAGWLGWIVERTVFPDGVDPDRCAAAILAVIEGVSTLGLIGIDGGAGLAEALCRSLEGR